MVWAERDARSVVSQSSFTIPNESGSVCERKGPVHDARGTG